MALSGAVTRSSGWHFRASRRLGQIISALLLLSTETFGRRAAAANRLNTANAADFVAPPSAPNSEPVGAERWSFRLGLRLGTPWGSNHESALEADGYSGIRYAGTLSAARRLNDAFAVGVLALYGGRSATSAPPGPLLPSEPPAPTYQEQFALFAAQVPVTLLRRPLAALSLNPYGGFGVARAALHSGGRWQTGPALGLDAAVFLRRAYCGVAVGANWQPLPRLSRADSSNNLGMVYVELRIGFDVH